MCIIYIHFYKYTFLPFSFSLAISPSPQMCIIKYVCGLSCRSCSGLHAGANWSPARTPQSPQVRQVFCIMTSNTYIWRVYISGAKSCWKRVQLLSMVLGFHFHFWIMLMFRGGGGGTVTHLGGVWPVNANFGTYPDSNFNACILLHPLMLYTERYGLLQLMLSFFSTQILNWTLRLIMTIIMQCNFP